MTTIRDQDHEDTLDVEDRFAIVPEWLLDAPISDCAVRLYAVLLRYGHSSGSRMPARSTLAQRLHKRSTDTVDRAMRDLVALGAVQVQARYAGRERLTNLYRVRTSRPDHLEMPGRRSDATPVTVGGGRTDRGTRNIAAGRTPAPWARRTDRATPAAAIGHDPESLTEIHPSSPRSANTPVWSECGIDDWERFVAECADRRLRVARPTGRWVSSCLDAALQLAVRGRQWPAELAAQALLAVASDPDTRSPMRVAEAGPWWDGTNPRRETQKLVSADVVAAEEELAEAGGLRVKLQQEARRQLSAEGVPSTRATVALRAAELLHAHAEGESAS